MIQMRRKTNSTLRLVVHPGSGAYVCRVLAIRFPNVRFVVVDGSDKYIHIHSRDKITAKMEKDYADAIAVLMIVFHLTGGIIADVIHG